MMERRNRGKQFRTNTTTTHHQRQTETDSNSCFPCETQIYTWMKGTQKLHTIQEKRKSDMSRLPAIQEQPYLDDMLEEVCNQAREVWVIGTRMNIIEEALRDLGIDLMQGLLSHLIW